MNSKEKGNVIALIVQQLRIKAESMGRSFCEGDTFFSLCFKSDKELKQIAKLCGI
ncbi:MAG: hypothetical protein GXP14_07345 [Gammaproteobacteria bacterium]|nr:hypothetical protein [Gammaproteobacteria bacterium]